MNSIMFKMQIQYEKACLFGYLMPNNVYFVLTIILFFFSEMESLGYHIENK